MHTFRNYIKIILLVLCSATLLINCKKKGPESALDCERPESPRMAITFDDGPDSVYTARILDILKQKNVKATFFLIGKHVQSYPELVQRIHREGHCIGNHTYTHMYLPNVPFHKISDQLLKTQNLIDSLCGPTLKIFRPPWGAINPDQVKKITELGYKVVLWNINSEDFNPMNNPNDIVNTVIARKNWGNVLLFHSADYNEQSSRENTVKALPIIIDILRDKYHFEFVRVDKL